MTGTRNYYCSGLDLGIRESRRLRVTVVTAATATGGVYEGAGSDRAVCWRQGPTYCVIWAIGDIARKLLGDG